MKNKRSFFSIKICSLIGVFIVSMNASSQETLPSEIPVEKNTTSSVEIAKKENALLPHKKKLVPVLEKLPESLPAKRIVVDFSVKGNVEIQKPVQAKLKNVEYLSYFVSENPVSGIGKIVGAELDLKAVGEFSHVFVEFDSGAVVAKGKKFVVQKNLAPIEKDWRIGDTGEGEDSAGGSSAQIIEVQGEIEVISPVNVEKRIYRAVVKRCINMVEVGSTIIQGEMPKINTTATAVNKISEAARIIGGQFGASRSLFGSNSLIFLDAGSARGLKPGVSLAIYADEGVRVTRTDIAESDRQVGVLKIIHASENYATAFVTQSTDDIRKGDFVGSAFKPPAKSSLDEDLQTHTEEAPANSGVKDDELDL